MKNSRGVAGPGPEGVPTARSDAAERGGTGVGRVTRSQGNVGVEEPQAVSSHEDPEPPPSLLHPAANTTGSPRKGDGSAPTLSAAGGSGLAHASPPPTSTPLSGRQGAGNAARRSSSSGASRVRSRNEASASPDASTQGGAGRPDGTKRRSRRQEEWVARVLRGNLVPGSGAFDRPGDVRTELFLVECKTTAENSFRLTCEVIGKLTAEAESEARSPMLALRFENAGAGVEPDWFAVPARVFLSLLDSLNRDAN